jgi:DNA-binding MarR family transcriptional regulator
MYLALSKVYNMLISLPKLIPTHFDNLMITLTVNLIMYKVYCVLSKLWKNRGGMRMAMDHLVDDILSLYHLIRRTSHPIHRAEITPEQYWLLRLLRRKGALSIGEVAEALGVTGSSITTACKRLEKAGLVTRERQNDDERMVHVMLTTLGHEHVEAWHQRRREIVEQWLIALESNEQAQLQHLLERLLEGAGEPLPTVMT